MLNWIDYRKALFGRIGEIAKLSPDTVKAYQTMSSAGQKADLLGAGNLMGILQQNPSVWLQSTDGLDAGEIERQIEARKLARKSKNFAEADRIREALAGQGVILEDGPQGTSWKRA